MYIHIYQNNPTVGLADGTLVSEGNTQTSAIIFTLNATNNQEGNPLKLGLRCDNTYQTTAGTNITITPTGTNSSKWALSIDGITWQAYNSALTITSQVLNVNKIFYVKCKSSIDETPQNDKSTSLQIVCQIESSL